MQFPIMQLFPAETGNGGGPSLSGSKAPDGGQGLFGLLRTQQLGALLEDQNASDATGESGFPAQLQALLQALASVQPQQPPSDGAAPVVTGAAQPAPDGKVPLPVTAPSTQPEIVDTTQPSQGVPESGSKLVPNTGTAMATGAQPVPDTGAPSGPAPPGSTPGSTVAALLKAVAAAASEESPQGGPTVSVNLEKLAAQLQQLSGATQGAEPAKPDVKATETLLQQALKSKDGGASLLRLLASGAVNEVTESAGLKPAAAEQLLAALSAKAQAAGDKVMAKLAGPAAAPSNASHTMAPLTAEAVEAPAPSSESAFSAADHRGSAARATDNSGVARPNPSAPPEPPARTTLNTLADDTIKSVRYLVSKGDRTMRLRLIPEHLGEVRIELRTRGDEMSIRLVSARSPVREALEGQLHGLREALARDGIEVGRVNVSANLSGGHDPDSNRFAQQLEQGSRRSAPYGTSGFEREGEADGQPSGGSVRNSQNHRGALDVFV